MAVYELEKAGYRCELLEARDRPGRPLLDGPRRRHQHRPSRDASRPRSSRDGHYMNAGPARIPQHHTTLDYCRELGVPIEVFVNANPDAYLLQRAGRRRVRPATGTPVRRRAAKADHIGYVASCSPSARSQGALDAELSADGPRRPGRLPARLRQPESDDDRYAGSASRGYAAAARRRLSRPGSSTPPYDLVRRCSPARLGLHFAFEQEWDQAMPMFQPVGGMDRIPHALAGAIRGRIGYGAEVRRIDVTADGVDGRRTPTHDGQGVAHQRRLLRLHHPAARCSRTIPHNLPAEVRTALSRACVPAPVGKIGLAVRAPLLGGGRPDLRRHHRHQPRHRDDLLPFLRLPRTPRRADRLLQLLRRLRALAALSPGGPRRARARAGRAGSTATPTATSSRTSFSRALAGPAVQRGRLGRVAAGPGRVRRRTPPCSSRCGRLYFAGDHLSYVTAWQHGAIESARHVVTQLHERVLSGSAAGP